MPSKAYYLSAAKMIREKPLYAVEMDTDESRCSSCSLFLLCILPYFSRLNCHALSQLLLVVSKIKISLIAPTFPPHLKNTTEAHAHKRETELRIQGSHSARSLSHKNRVPEPASR